jgi:hypothetical protein
MEAAKGYQKIVEEERDALKQGIEVKRLEMIRSTKQCLRNGHPVPPSMARHMLKHCANSFGRGEQAKLKERGDMPEEPPVVQNKMFKVDDKLAGQNLMSNRGTGFAVVTKVRANGMYTIDRVKTIRELVSESDGYRKTFRYVADWSKRLNDKTCMSATGTSYNGGCMWNKFNPDEEYIADIDGLD